MVETVKHEIPFPDNLEGRLNSITNVVNTEFKSIAFLHLDDSPVDVGIVRSRAKENVGEGYLPSAPCFKNYFDHSFLPIGMVSKFDVVNDNGDIFDMKYSLTSNGKKYGLPIAAFSLQWASDNDFSLFNVFGSTASSGKIRSPLARVNILRILYEGNSFPSKIAKSIGYASSPNGRANGPIFRIIEHLFNIGLVEFTQGKSRRVDLTYSFIDKEGSPTTWRNAPSLTSNILNFLREKGKINAEETRKYVGHKFRSDSTNVLNHLFKEGFASRNIPFHGKDNVGNDLALTREGNAFVEDYLLRIEDALNDGDALEEMTDYYHNLTNDWERFSKLIKKGIELYKEVSPRINRRGKDENKNMILSYIESNPGITPSKIEERFGFSRVQNYLTPLVKSRKLRKEKDGRNVKYYLA